MGREQGDELDKSAPIYTATVNGEVQERAAHSPADEVNLRARGWVLKAEKRGGKQQPAPPAVDMAPQDEAAARPGSSNA